MDDVDAEERSDGNLARARGGREHSLTIAWRYAWSMALPTTVPPMTMRLARSLPACPNQ
jgi:hypothetical protein